MEDSKPVSIRRLAPERISPSHLYIRDRMLVGGLPHAEGRSGHTRAFYSNGNLRERRLGSAIR